MTNILLETPRLVIKETDMAEFEMMYALFSDTEVMQYIGMRSREEARERLEKFIVQQHKHGFGVGNVFVC